MVVNSSQKESQNTNWLRTAEGLGQRLGMTGLGEREEGGQPGKGAECLLR